jgi:hypothetical protein
MAIGLYLGGILWSAEQTMGNALADNRKYPANHQQRRTPTGCVSRSEHPLNAGVHFCLFDKFTSCNLVYANLHLRLEPFIMGKQRGNGLLPQFVGSPSGPVEAATASVNRAFADHAPTK